MNKILRFCLFIITFAEIWRVSIGFPSPAAKISINDTKVSSNKSDEAKSLQTGHVNLTKKANGSTKAPKKSSVEESDGKNSEKKLENDGGSKHTTKRPKDKKNKHTTTAKSTTKVPKTTTESHLQKDTSLVGLVKLNSGEDIETLNSTKVKLSGTRATTKSPKKKSGVGSTTTDVPTTLKPKPNAKVDVVNDTVKVPANETEVQTSAQNEKGSRSFGSWSQSHAGTANFNGMTTGYGKSDGGPLVSNFDSKDIGNGVEGGIIHILGFKPVNFWSDANANANPDSQQLKTSQNKTTTDGGDNTNTTLSNSSNTTNNGLPRTQDGALYYLLESTGIARVDTSKAASTNSIDPRSLNFGGGSMATGGLLNQGALGLSFLRTVLNLNGDPGTDSTKSTNSAPLNPGGGSVATGSDPLGLHLLRTDGVFNFNNGMRNDTFNSPRAPLGPNMPAGWSRSYYGGYY